MAGVSVLQPTNYNRLIPPDALSAHPMKTVAPRTGGGVWIGTEGGGVYRFAGGEWTVFDRASGLSSPYVWSVLEDRSGRVWAGTWGAGVFRMNPRGDRFERVAGLEDPRALVAVLFEARDGAIWIGGIHGLKRYADGMVTSYGIEQGLLNPDVRALAEDAAGGIWFGVGGGGLGVLREGRLQLYGPAEGLSADFIISLYFDRTGTLWFGSTAGGVTRFKNGKFVHIGRELGFPGRSIGHITEDEAGNFCLASDRGIFRIVAAGLNACADGVATILAYERFGDGEGQEHVESATGSQPAGCMTADGLLWYPARQHLIRMDPTQRIAPPVPPRVLIEELVVDGSPVAGVPGRTLVIGPGHERFDFRYNAPTFSGADRIRFRYRLAGLDEDWINAGEERNASYHHLPPGRYRFEVLAQETERSVVTEPAALALLVEPQWWQHWWVGLLVYLAAALGIASSVAWLLRRSHRRKTEQLERQQVLERERTRIARDIHDDLGMSLTRISLLSQSTEQELADPAQTARRIQSIYSTARELTYKMDEIVWAVNPLHDSLESVVNYFISIAQEMLTVAGVACRLDMPLRLPAQPVFAEARHHLFLAFKEALHNVVKHAGASCVTISLVASDTMLTLKVQDDGHGLCGKDPSARQGNGLANMRQRLADVGGRLHERGLAGTVPFTSDYNYGQNINGVFTQTPEDRALQQKHVTAVLGAFPANLFTAWAIPTTEAKWGFPPNSPQWDANAPWGRQPPGYTITQDLQTKGQEYELIFNPLPNWTISANASKTRAITTNNIGNLVEWIEARNVIWNSDAGQIRLFGGSTGTGTILQNWNSTVYSPYLLEKGKNGLNVAELRPWRFNIVTNYNFTSQRLKGLSVGGSYRWEDRQAIGYPGKRVTLDTGTTVDSFDVQNPVFGPSDGSVDLWAGYERKLTEKIKWRIQVNARNVFGKNELVPISVQPDGTYSSYRIKEGPTWTVTNTFTF